MNFEALNDDGVSPVIGVVLMVAVTVILAALIASFAFGLGGGLLSENPQAGVSFDENSSAGTVTVQLISLENADKVSIERSDNSSYRATFKSVGQSVTIGDGTVGSLESGSGDPAINSGARITVTATLEGKTQVIQTYEFEG